MKKTVKVLLTLLLCLTLCVALIACGEEVCQHRDIDDDSKCDKCNESYTDGKDVICMHTELVTIERKEATCTESGLTEGKTCKNCGTITVAQTIIEASHKFLGKTCEICGFVKESEGFAFTENSDGTYTVTSNAYCFDVNMIIPSAYRGKPVTAIAEKAFYDCNFIRSITIPDSVKSIDYMAFSDCSSLTSVTIPDSVTEIGEYAFSGCFKLTSVTIGNSVTEIGSYAFYNCSSLTSVTIPNSVTEIGEYAFSGCSSLTSVTIGNSVAEIGEYAFSGCSSLTSIHFNGTKAEWKAISKGSNWKSYIGSFTVYCSDGNLTGSEA